MALGCLATIANVKPRNLTIVIWDNGIYQITGRQQAAAGRWQTLKPNRRRSVPGRLLQSAPDRLPKAQFVIIYYAE
jgi:thiamine pyrophosphate-dependent acetolactate synthase large subunit-like protein